MKALIVLCLSLKAVSAFAQISEIKSIGDFRKGDRIEFPAGTVFHVFDATDKSSLMTLPGSDGDECVLRARPLENLLAMPSGSGWTVKKVTRPVVTDEECRRSLEAKAFDRYGGKSFAHLEGRDQAWQIRAAWTRFQRESSRIRNLKRPCRVGSREGALPEKSPEVVFGHPDWPGVRMSLTCSKRKTDARALFRTGGIRTTQAEAVVPFSLRLKRSPARAGRSPASQD